MPTDISLKLLELRIESLKMVLESFRKDYTVQEDVFSKLDQKAQGIISLAGAFLAAALAFVKLDELGNLFNTVGVFGVLILALSIVILICVVGASVWATSLRQCPLPPQPSILLETTEDVLRLGHDDLSFHHFENNIRQEIGFWRLTNEAFEVINNDKSGTIITAQIGLALAILLIGILLLVILIAVYVTPQ